LNLVAAFAHNVFAVNNFIVWYDNIIHIISWW
jgi:hypothetical protein